MPIEAALVGFVASTGSAFITLWKHGSHLVDIPAEVGQFKIAIDNLETSLNTARRLRRINSRYLDQVMKAEIDGTIECSQSVLDSICRTIENCRADMQVKGTVRWKNRVDWIFSGHDQFMARGMTLNSCLQVLGMQIQRMDGNKPANKISVPGVDEALPSYHDSVPERRLRAPSMRRNAFRGKLIDALDVCSEEARNDIIETKDDTSIYAPDEFHVDTDIRHLHQSSCRGDYCVDEFCTNNDRISVHSTPIVRVEQTLVVEDLTGGYRGTGQPGRVLKANYTSTTSLRRNRSGLM